MPSGAILAGRNAEVVELTKYRSMRARLVPGQVGRNEYRDSIADFAKYFRERTVSIGVSSYGLEKLAVALDLRQVRFLRTLGSMISDDNLSGEAQHALSPFRCLSSKLALPVPNSCSVAQATNKLAYALYMLVATLDMKATSSNRTIR